ncbi:S-layer homology domain-containing protein [Paenibacillus alkaliterrae]|uniref:S-layer homology domain-containing protein n=1 Tax=Paenibacillus alkaliterrae TaxID=320909 RepID=UPI001F351045|nr:S-layer homology domain-containing protein [Paenibacillus alkaliterrae]MCF2939755.1 S-layer homology domain-containing protein [Paenibacillus alkaliterrae]
MTLRKKLAVSTIAASVAMSAFAGIPLSNKGLAEKLGVSGVAYASAAFPSATVTTKVKQLRDALIATNGLDKVQELRAVISGLSDPVKGDIADPIVAKFMKGTAPADQAAKIAVLKNLFVDVLALTYDPSLTGLEKIRTEYNGVLQSYASAAQVPDLTIDNIVNYFLLIQDQAMLQLRTKSYTELSALLTDPVGFNKLLEQSLAALPDKQYDVEKILLYYGVTTEDVASVLSNLKIKVDNNGKFAIAALALYNAYLHLNPAPVTPTPGGGIITPPPVTIEVPKEAADLAGKLVDLKGAITKATGEEKAKLIEEAVKEAQTLVDKLAEIKNTVTIVDGKAALKLDENKTLSAIAGIAAIADSLKAAATGTELSALKVTIDLGAVAQDDVEIDLSTAIMEQAIKAGLTAVSLKVDDLTVDLPVGGTFSSAINFTINKSDASEEVTGGLKAASKVYDFNLSIGGVATTTFSQPIVISIPLGDTTGLDIELLSIAKIVDGKLEFHGGRIENGHIIEPRDTFSSYVVVENKVSFNDLARVQAWAGRSIEVVAAKGAIIGKSEGVFAPDAKVTRAEFAKMLIRALDLDNSSATEGFADVKAGDWFAPYVAAAAELKIINGRSASKFDPNATITRAEMATMIARALKVSQGASDVADVDAALKGFSDTGKISASLKDGVAFAASHEIVIGSNGKFAPNSNATRAEAAVIIYRAINFGK